MASFGNRLFASNVLRKRNVFKSFGTLQQRQKLSTQTEPKAKTTEDEGAVTDPLNHPDFFQVHNLFTIKDLFNARVHLGHMIGSVDNRMKPFVFGSRLGHLIIDLDQTAELLRMALNFTAHIAFQEGVILFLSRNPYVTFLVDSTAKECGEYSHTRHFKRGTFTNATIEFKAITRLPDLCIFLNTFSNNITPHIGIEHAAKMCIPSIGIVDTNANPNLLTYPVPGNDDSYCAIELYCKLFKAAILRGKEARNLLKQQTTA